MTANNSSTITLSGDELKGHNAKNGTCSLSFNLEAITISYASIYSILLIASFVGNYLLIYASLRSNIKIGRTVANIAASDLLFSTVHLPREIVVQIKSSAAFLVSGWIGLLFCKICAFVTDVSIAVSTLSLVLLSVDRMIAVVFPRKYRRVTNKKRRFLILSTWISAMAIHSPYFYTFRLDTIDGETFCLTNWEPAFNHESTHACYYTALLVTVLILPLVTVSILNTVLLVKRRSEKMAPLRSSIASRRHIKINKKAV